MNDNRGESAAVNRLRSVEILWGAAFEEVEVRRDNVMRETLRTSEW